MISLVLFPLTFLYLLWQGYNQLRTNVF